MQTIAVIGGGFSGTMAAVNLARLSDKPLRVVLINDRHPLGRGVAYGTKRFEHLLNVAARNMSAVPDQPDHFLDWLRTRVEYADLPDPQLRETFVPRAVYGDYLRALLLNYLRPIDDHHPAAIEVIEDEVVDILTEHAGRAHVMLRGGERLEVDRVLLATGNQPPAPLGNAEEPFEHPAYCADPWGDWSRELPESGEDVIVLGTGLTMVDVFLTLKELKWQGRIIAVSRNGMIPQSHFRGIEYPDFLPANPESVGLQALVDLLEQHCRQIRRLGENPAIVIDRLRPHTQRIWQHLTCAEKQEFLSQYAARWNVVRHRIAQPIHQRMTESLIDQQLRIVRGNVTGLSAAGQRVQVSVTSAAGEQSTLEAGFVINCTGPHPAFSESPVPLFQNLMQRDLIQVDEMDMGIQVGANFAVLDAQGRNSEFLFAIGPLMKGSLWETTAVPELRGQAMRVAEVLVEEAGASDQERDYRLSVEEEHVIEYHI